MIHKNTNGYRWVILMIACFAIFSPNYAQYQLSPVSKEIIEMFSLSNSQFSSVFSAPMIPGIFLSLAAGLLVDRFGVKAVIAAGLVISSVGTVLRITSETYNTLFLSMLMIGFGATFLNANGTKIFSGWFPSEKISMVMGLFLAASMISMTLGVGTTAMLPSLSSAFLVSAVVHITAATLWIIFAKNAAQYSENGIDTLPLRNCLRVVVKNRTVWLVGFSLMFISGVLVLVNSFLPTALNSRGIDAVSAGGYTAMISIGNLAGCIISPLADMKLKNTRALIISFSIISGMMTIFSWRMPEGFLLLLCLGITGVAMGGLLPLLMSIPIRLKEIGPAYAGTAGGFTATIQLSGAVVIPSCIIVPLAGSRMDMLFVLGGIFMITVCVFGFFMTDLNK